MLQTIFLEVFFPSLAGLPNTQHVHVTEQVRPRIPGIIILTNMRASGSAVNDHRQVDLSANRLSTTDKPNTLQVTKFEDRTFLLPV